MGKVYPNNGSSAPIDIPAGEKIAIFSTGKAEVYYRDSYANVPSNFYLASSLENEEVVLTPGVNQVQIYSYNDEVIYEVGADPKITQIVPDVLEGVTSPFDMRSKDASSVFETGYAANITSGKGYAGSSATSGTSGGTITHTSGDGGAKTGTGTANGGSAGDIYRVGGTGGDTAAIAPSSSGGRGGDIIDVAGNGGAATAGTANGGNGGSISRAPGSGGSSAGGSVGYDGMLFDNGLVLYKQEAPTAKTTSSTLTAAELKAKIITINQGSGAASAQQLPTAAVMDISFPDATADFAFTFRVINRSTVDAEDASITTNTGWTLVGPMDIPAYSASGSLNSSRDFIARKTGTGAWELYG